MAKKIDFNEFFEQNNSDEIEQLNRYLKGLKLNKDEIETLLIRLLAENMTEKFNDREDALN